jgi:hypothetical protein
MSRNIRIRTEPNSGDKNVKIQLNQDFDFLEILSLKISQEDVYRSFYSDYGVVVGRVIMNSGVGVPNARVSIFIPLTDEDADNPEIATIYPYADLQDVNSDGVRYNTLPSDAQGECHAPIGTFPTKRELVDNPELFEVYQKYYKYTTTTNGAGDFMLFGVPVGNHTLNVDVDLSDIGIFSQRPYDFIEQGNPSKLFDSPTKFKTGTNLNNLTQVKNRQVGVNVIPFWGEQQSNEVGISRIDVDLNYNIQPTAIFMGSIFGDNEKNSVNKNCRPRKKLGRVCEMGEGQGTIEIIRKNEFGEVEELVIEGGQLIDDNGVWAFQVPMNLDYLVTDEFGQLVPTDDPNKGIPTRSRARFKISLNETGGNGRLRTKAKYLVPHNPNTTSEVDYSFDDSTSDVHFRDMYWNKIYTVKNHIGRFQKNRNFENRNFIGFKDVDNCVGVKNPIPFNKLDTDFNPLYTIICLIISFVIEILAILNNIISFQIKVGPFRVRPFCGIGCIKLTCPLNDITYTPGCRNRCGSTGFNSKDEALDCFQIALAETLNVFEFDFYNEWLNGALYPFLLKYKRTSNDEKYCGNGNGDNNNFMLNTNPPNGRVTDSEGVEIDEGVIADFEGELFYKPISRTNGEVKMFATDIYNLGAVFNCDWQGQPRVQQDLIATTYQIPPVVNERSEDGQTVITTGLIPLLFNLSCTNVSVNNSQSRSIRRICELGVGLDDDDSINGVIDNEDIDSTLVRSKLIKLNDPNYAFDDLDTIKSEFTSLEYGSYRGEENNGGISQFNQSFYFYFGTIPNNSALDLMNSKYFTSCSRTERAVITILGEIKDVTTVGGSDGEIDITVVGGSPEYTYEWYNSEDPNTLIATTDSQDVTGLSAGSYFVIVTDQNGAQARKTFIVDGLKDISISLRLRNTQTSTANNGIIFINSITGGIGPYDVRVESQGVVGTPYDETQNDVPYATQFTGLDEGQYQITVSDSSNGAIVDFTTGVTINVPTTLTVDVTALPTNCVEFNDGQVELSIQGGTPDYSVSFSSVTSNSTFTSDVMYPPLGSSSPATVTYDGLEPGTYAFRVIDEFGQEFPSTGIPQQVNVVDTPFPVLVRQGNANVNLLIATQLRVGDEYRVQRGGDDIGNTFIATSSGVLVEDAIGVSTPPDDDRYQIISQFGCASDAVK